MYLHVCEAHGIYMEGMCVLAVEHMYIPVLVCICTCTYVKHMVSIWRACVYWLLNICTYLYLYVYVHVLTCM